MEGLNQEVAAGTPEFFGDQDDADSPKGEDFGRDSEMGSPSHKGAESGKLKEKGMNKEELEKVADIMLCETETETLLNFPSLCVALDNIAVHSAVSARNKAYDELVAVKGDGGDQYKEQHAQTLNNPHKM